MILERDLEAELAATLARDVSDDVALPIIQFSEALRDEDLIEIIRTQPEIRQVAVAGRPAVSEKVADTLVDEGAAEAVVTLVGNQNAALSEKTLNKVVDKYGDDDRFQEPLVHRPKLPVTVAERLVSLVSDSLQKHLVTHHDLPEEAAIDLLMQTREKATISLVSAGADDDDLDALVAQLKANGRLTPSLVLRALCMGDMAFFEVAMACMASVPLGNARILIHDEGDLGLRSVYDKAGLPKALFPAFRTAFGLARGTEEERFDDDPETQMRRMLERVLTVHEDIVEEYGVENVEYLLTKFNKLQHAGVGDDGPT